MRENRRGEGGGGGGAPAVVEVEIYSGIEFTRFNRTPPPHPPPRPLSLSLLKNTWCKLTLCQQVTAKEGRKERVGEGQREQTREEEISGIAVRSEECLHFVPAASHGP